MPPGWTADEAPEACQEFRQYPDARRAREIPHLVLPGNPDGSKLFNQLANKEMPYDLYYDADLEVPAVSEAELTAIHDWIKGLGKNRTAACSSRKFIDHKSDRERDREGSRSPAEAPRARHALSHAHQPLQRLRQREELEVYRQGAVKLLNSLSRSSTWSASRRSIPSGRSSASTSRISAGDAATGTRCCAAILTACGPTPDVPVHPEHDRYAAALYPGRLVRVHRRRSRHSTRSCSAARHFSDLQRAGRRHRGEHPELPAQRAGFQKSGVSQNNRLIERHKSAPAISGRPTTSPATGTSRACSSSRSDRGQTAQRTASSTTAAKRSSPCQRIPGLLPQQRPRHDARQGPDQDRARPVAQGPHGDQRHLLHGLPRPGIRKAKDEIRAFTLKTGLLESDPGRGRGSLPGPERMDVILEDDTARFRRR